MRQMEYEETQKKVSEIRTSALPKPNERHADANDKHSSPSTRSHAFPEKELSAECACRIVQRRHGHDKTHVLDGKHRQKRKKSQRHHGNADPHPRHPHGAQNYTDNRQWTKISHLSHALHGARNTDLPSRPADDNQK